jgi:hypothetical protein
MTNKTNQICRHCGKEKDEHYPSLFTGRKRYCQPPRIHQSTPTRFAPIPQQPPQEPEGKHEAIANELLNINDTCRSRGFEAGPSGRATSDRVVALAQAYDAAKARIEELERERDELKSRCRTITCVYCGHKESLDSDGANERLSDHILTCDDSPLVQALSSVSLCVEPLIDLLRKRAGDKESGWCGTVVIDDEFISVFESAQESLATGDRKVEALLAERDQLKQKLADAVKALEAYRDNRSEQCQVCMKYTTDWIEPDGSPGRICRPCESALKSLKGEGRPHVGPRQETPRNYFWRGLS